MLFKRVFYISCLLAVFQLGNFLPSAFAISDGEGNYISIIDPSNSGTFQITDESDNDIVTISYEGPDDYAYLNLEGKVDTGDPGSCSSGDIYFNTFDQVFKGCIDGGSNLWSTLKTGTLDEAYDEGGAGAGRAITVDANAVQLTGSNAADETLEITNSGNGGVLLVENTGAGDTVRFNDEASDASPFVIDDEGNVGIGTEIPTGKLHVDVDASDAISGILIEANDVDEIALEIDAAQTSEDIIQIDATELVSESLLQATVDASLNASVPLMDIVASDADDTLRVIEVNTDEGDANDIEAVVLDRSGASPAIVSFDEASDNEWKIDQGDGVGVADLQGVYVGTSQPAACDTGSPDMTGRMWFESDTGIMYVCDTSNGRDAWLSLREIALFGDESGSCGAGNDMDADGDCSVDWGNGLGTDGGNDALGLYIPRPATITAYGISMDNDACTSQSYMAEVRYGDDATDDNGSFQANTLTLESNLQDETEGATQLNFEIPGPRYIRWGINNGCGQAIDDWNMVIYLRWRSS